MKTLMQWIGCSVIRRVAACLLFLTLVSSLISLGSAAEPRIYLITLDGDDALIHFDTEPNRRYVLQSINRLHCGPGQNDCNRQGIATNWSNIYTAHALPFFNHYIVPDRRTTARRFYRLRVTTP